ncbi:hypothetical protein IFO70_02915 [Phormidium tenue FACHB-886]|nr:hypothetical protein [Phormidium tenue FACHB-886]
MAKNSLKAKKNSRGKHTASDNKILGLDVREIGTAIASAVLAELAQVAINKATQSSKLPDGATVAGRTKTSLKDMGNTVKSTLTDASPIEIALETLKDVMDRASPMGVETAETVEEAPRAASQFVKETAETAEDRAVDTADLIGNGIAEAIDATKNSTGDAKQAVQTAVGGATQSLKTALEDTTTPSKKQKNKKKKSAKKSGKKNKKK